MFSTDQDGYFEGQLNPPLQNPIASKRNLDIEWACNWVTRSAHRLTERNSWVKFNENNTKGSEDMERTQNWTINPITFKYEYDLECA